MGIKKEYGRMTSKKKVEIQGATEIKEGGGGCLKCDARQTRIDERCPPRKVPSSKSTLLEDCTPSILKGWKTAILFSVL